MRHTIVCEERMVYCQRHTLDLWVASCKETEIFKRERLFLAQDSDTFNKLKKHFLNLYLRSRIYEFERYYQEILFKTFEKERDDRGHSI